MEDMWIIILIVFCISVFIVFLGNKEISNDRKKREESCVQKEENPSPESIKDDISKYDLGDSLKRLKKMYSDGTLTKNEFEQAKNKLLK
jgi:uncharacterized membrane protein